MKQGEIIALTITVAVIGLGAFIYMSAQKTSAAVQSATAGTSNVNALAGTVNKLLNGVIQGAQG